MTMKRHLHYDLIGADHAGVKDHAQKVMRDLGIVYEIAVPQSMSDSWHFWACSNVPAELPPYITIREDWKPRNFIGWGLSKAEADRLDMIDMAA